MKKVQSKFSRRYRIGLPNEIILCYFDQEGLETLLTYISGCLKRTIKIQFPDKIKQNIINNAKCIPWDQRW